MTYKKGMTIVEIMIVLAIVSIALFAINQLIITGLQANIVGLSYTKALWYAQEGAEVMRILKNESWQSNIAPLTQGTPYYAVLSGGVWSLQTISPGLLDNVFARTIMVEDVYRDAEQNIAASGTLDPDTKKIIVTLQWQHPTGQKTIVIPAYISNIEGT